MSSRSKDAKTISELHSQVQHLATTLHEIAGGCVKMVGTLEAFSQDLHSQETRVGELNEAVNEHERRLITLERG